MFCSSSRKKIGEHKIKGANLIHAITFTTAAGDYIVTSYAENGGIMFIGREDQSTAIHSIKGFFKPVGNAIDQMGHVYVARWGENKIVKY